MASMRSKRPRGRPTSVADVLGQVLQRVDPDHQLKAYSLWTFWDEVVGKTIATRAQPQSFSEGVLVIAVATHTWMQELSFMKAALLDHLNTRLGARLIREISLVPGELGTAATPPASDAPDYTPVESHLIALPPIAHPELAGAFDRVVQARARRLARSRAAAAQGNKHRV